MMDTDNQPAAPNESYQYVFTVFTPTFNRAYTLSRVYNSLKSQTYRNFEWLIIDDGSTDDTSNLVKQWQKEAGFCIRYIRQENQGKHRAFNRGVQEAKGELFLTFDSDDACVPEALEKFKYYWDSISENERYKFSGVTVLCTNQNGMLVGNKFPFDVTDSDGIEIHNKYRVFGEKWGFQKTNVLKDFPFPEIVGEKFITEATVWNRISLKYKTRFVNEKLRVYYEGLTDSLSNASLKVRAQNPKGSVLYYQEYLKLPIPVKYKLKNIINYIRFSCHGNLNFQQLLKASNHKLLTAMLLPVGYFYYKKRYY